MNVEQQIELCQIRLAEIHRYVKGLQADGIPESEPVYDVLAEKGWEHVFRWEILAALDLGTMYSVREYDISRN